MTPLTISYNFGDVVLVPFPFTNQATTKQRPAVVVSSTAYNVNRPDLILMAISSQMGPAGIIGEVAVTEWQQAGRLKPSVIKPIITTVEKRLVRRKLGELEAVDRTTLESALRLILG